MNRQQRLEELAKQAKRTKTKRWGLWIGIGLPVLIALLFLLAKVTDNGDAASSASTTAVPTTVLDTTTSVDPNASTTVAASTTVDPNATTTTLAPFAYGKGGCPAVDGTSVKQSTFAQAFKLCIDPT